MLAISEQARGGPASRLQNYAVVKVSSGVGCGLVANGGLVRGSNGYAGDLGHVCTDPGSDAVCACGNTLRILALLSLEAIGQAAQLGDPAATAMLRVAGRHLAYAIAGLATIFSPAAVFSSTGIRGAAGLPN